MAGQFARHQRLLTGKDFDFVFARSYKRHHATLTLLCRPNRRSYARLGLAVPKRAIKLAVQRNRFKRITRESFRQNQVQLAGLDIVVIAKASAVSATNQQLLDVFEQQWQHLTERFKQSS